MAITAKRKTGDIGEEITAKYLANKGFTVVERNYLRPWGEIDIIAQKDNLLHFVEVKTVTRESPDFSPADNMHSDKKERQRKIVETYLSEKRWGGDWQVDLTLVYLDETNKKAKIELLENIELA